MAKYSTKDAPRRRLREGVTALRTDGRTDERTDERTDGQTDGRTDGWTDPFIEMQRHI